MSSNGIHWFLKLGVYIFIAGIGLGLWGWSLINTENFWGILILVIAFLVASMGFVFMQITAESYKPNGRSHIESVYDFYIETCQLCASRAVSGQRYLIDDCGWCNDSDTFYRSDSKETGNIIKLTPETGYPFHNNPHRSRKYYKNNEYLPKLDGTLPQEPIVPEKQDNTSALVAAFFLLAVSGSVLYLIGYYFYARFIG